MKKIKAQCLYDWRAIFEHASGSDLSKFFDSQLGTPSPKGSMLVSQEKAINFAMETGGKPGVNDLKKVIERPEYYAGLLDGLKCAAYDAAERERE